MVDFENHKKQMQPLVDKMVVQLASKGISFRPYDGDNERLPNVVFSNGIKHYRMSQASLYGYSRIASFTKELKDKKGVETIPVTDEMYLNMIIRPIVDNFFKNLK